MAKNAAKPDWDAIERDYRTAKFTLRELSTKHGPSHQAIAKRAKTKEWSQDLAEQIRLATSAKLVAELVDKEVAAGGQAVANTVLVAAEINKQVILGHREQAKKVFAAWETALAKVQALANDEDPKLALAMPSAVESLGRTAKIVAELERKAYALDDTPPAPPAPVDLSSVPPERAMEAYLAWAARR